MPGATLDGPPRHRTVPGRSLGSAGALPPLGRRHPALRAPEGAQLRPRWTLGRCVASAREQLELEKTRVEEREKPEECARIAEGLLTDFLPAKKRKRPQRAKLGAYGRPGEGRRPL